MKTHRCEGSLKARVSIRYEKQYPISWRMEDDKDAWRLFHQISDYEYDNIKCHVSEIKYCPYCAKKLEECDNL